MSSPAILALHPMAIICGPVLQQPSIGPARSTIRGYRRPTSPDGEAGHDLGADEQMPSVPVGPAIGGIVEHQCP